MLDGSRFETTDLSGAVAVLGYLTAVNVLVLVFNLIPGFPLDGGRIARAIAWKLTGDRNRATRFAARLGRLAGWGMVGVRRPDPRRGHRAGTRSPASGSIFIGFFLASAARSAEAEAEFSDRIDHLRVSDVMDAEPVAIPERLPLDRAEGEFFLRYGWPWFPVVDETGHLVGVVSREAVEQRAGGGPRRARRSPP